EDRGGNYTDTIEEIKTARSGDGLSLPEAAQKYTDAKPIMILIRWGFLAEGDSLPGGSKKIIIAPEVIQKYKTRLQNLKIYNVDMDCDKPITDNNKSLTCKIRYNTGYESDKKFSRNRILFGAPGTGKSYTLNKEKDELLSNGGECERVTFHPDYSYANFVGTYKPTVLDSVNDLVLSEDKKEVLSILLDKSKIAQEKYDLLYDKFKEESLTRLPILLGLYTDESFKTKKKDGTNASGDNSVERNHGKAIRPYINLISEKRSTNEISYEYVPGPFMRTLVKALKNSKESITKPHVLVIEEINRANVAAVFGDVFQLLDRDDNNVSEYPIQTSEDMKRYLAKELGGDIDEYTEICIPDNMFIWSTMNSADQGVFPMDTAFKR
ncbi:AAA family ATPase, partial [Aminipila sp.]|uniref:AAA family ATPase n=1 Tax=Aminipila sp. TaxID=2060095 RepID=UPI0028A1193F